MVSGVCLVKFGTVKGVCKVSSVCLCEMRSLCSVFVVSGVPV